MRRPWIVLALLIGGCAAAGIETAADVPPQTGSIAPPTDAAETAHGALRKAQHKAVEEARRPLRAFLADPTTDCSSPKTARGGAQDPRYGECAHRCNAT